MNALLLALALSASTASVPVQAPKKAGKVWTCGQPQALATDRVQTVRFCEFK